MTKTAAELRKEIREDYDEYMRNHYAKIEIDFLLSGLPVKPTPVKQFFFDEAQSVAVTQKAQLSMRTMIFVIQSKRTDDILHLYIDTESTIDRMVREAKSRLAVSIEANANYELIQMKKKYCPTTLREAIMSLGVPYELLATDESDMIYKGLSFVPATPPKSQRARHPLDHYGFISPVKGPTRSYKMPEKASRFGQWVQDTSEGARPGQMVWQDGHSKLLAAVRSAKSSAEKMLAKLQLNSLY